MTIKPWFFWDNESLSRVPEYRYMKIARRNIPDRLVDFCKRSSINRRFKAAQVQSWIFFSFSNYSNTPYLTSLNTVRP